MGFLTEAIAGIPQLYADFSGTPAPWDDFWYGPIGAPSATGMRVTPDTALRVGAVLACVSKISKCIGMFPLRLYREGSDGSKQLATNHPLYNVLYRQPNHFQTAYEFRQMMQGHLELRGNAYAEILSGPRRAVDQLMPLHPDRVMVERLKPSGRLRYRYQDPLLNQDRYLAQEEVFHLRNFSDDGAVGRSTISMAVDTIGVALAAQDYYARFLKNDARPSFFVTGANFKTKQMEEDFRERLQAGGTGVNRHKVGILGSGMDIKSLSLASKDAELLDARKFSRIEICSIFDMPPHAIGEIEKTASYASVEQFNIMLATFCLLPRVVNWEQTIQRDLIFDDSYFSKFSMGSLLRGDNASRAAFYEKMWQIGVLSEDDIRIEEDLNPIPGGSGSKYWRPLNFAPIDQLSAPAAAPPPSSSGDEGAEVQPSDGQENALAKFRMLASFATDPCVRREINAIRKLRERSGGNGEFSEALSSFYREHVGWLRERLHLPEAIAAEYCNGHRDFLLDEFQGSTFDARLEMLSRFAARNLGAQLTQVIQ